MHSQLLTAHAGTRRFILVLDRGEEACATITGFARREGITGASLTAIGAFEKVVLGWFDVDAKQYRPIEVNQQCEALSLIGDIAIDDKGGPSLHVHAVVGLRDGTTRGGHLMQAVVQPTLEVILLETPVELRRKKRPDIGAALIDLD